jgi:hypothetical protein
LEICPADWEYNHAKSFLAKRVHRNNKEISPIVSDLPKGKSRKQQRQDAEARVTEERANARAVRESVDEANQERRNIQMRIAKLAAIKTQTDSISSQLRLLQDHKEHFIAKHGESAFTDKVNALLDKLPDPSIDDDSDSSPPPLPSPMSASL